jgi:hypothetical protein
LYPNEIFPCACFYVLTDQTKHVDEMAWFENVC